MFLHAFLSTGEDTVLRRVLTCWLQGLIAVYARQVSNKSW